MDTSSKMSPPGAQLPALLTLITDATKTVESFYRKTSVPFVPSLDDTTPHPLDTQVSPPELRRAIETIEGACAQLCATVARPSHTMMNNIMGFYEPACYHVVVKGKIPDLLSSAPGGMHVSELSEKSGIEKGKLSRVLRLLASKHCFREVTLDVFANNRLSSLLLSTNPMSDTTGHITDENMKSATQIADVLTDPEWGHSYSPTRTGFNKWVGLDKSLFEYFSGATPEGAVRGARFGGCIVGWNIATGSESTYSQYPWGGLKDGASVCDVGSGLGSITIQLAKTYPSLRIKLQDREDVIERAKTEFWPKECPEAIAENRVEFKAMDFLTEPPVEGCDVYFLKNVLHDWPDKECLQILNGVSKAMAAHSRMLVQEYILLQSSRVPDEESRVQQAPEPLLPNFGVGKIRLYNSDINMMGMLNAQERRLESFIELAAKAGLKFLKFWDAGEMGMVEFVKA